MHTHACIRTCIHIHLSACVYLRHICVCMLMYVCMYVFMCVYIYIYVYIYIQTYVCACSEDTSSVDEANAALEKEKVRTYIYSRKSRCICLFLCIWTCCMLRTPSVDRTGAIVGMYVCMCSCTFGCDCIL